MLLRAFDHHLNSVELKMYNPATCSEQHHKRGTAVGQRNRAKESELRQNVLVHPWSILRRVVRSSDMNLECKLPMANLHCKVVSTRRGTALQKFARLPGRVTSTMHDKLCNINKLHISKVWLVVCMY